MLPQTNVKFCIPKHEKSFRLCVASSVFVSFFLEIKVKTIDIVKIP